MNKKLMETVTMITSSRWTNEAKQKQIEKLTKKEIIELCIRMCDLIKEAEKKENEQFSLVWNMKEENKLLNQDMLDVVSEKNILFGEKCGLEKALRIMCKGESNE